MEEATAMTEETFARILTTEHSEDFVEWFFGNFETPTQKDHCSLEEFVIYFLNFLRNQIDDLIKGTSTCSTPRKLTALEVHHEEQPSPFESLNERNPRHNKTPNPRNVSRDLFMSSVSDFDDCSPLKEVRNFNNSIASSSTPLKLSTIPSSSSRSASKCSNDSTNSISSTSRSHSETPRRQNEKPIRSSKSQRSPMCLSDFMQMPSRASNVKRRTDGHQSAIFGDAEFPQLNTPKRLGNEQRPRTLSAETTKPSRRVVPTLLSGIRNEFDSPAFRSDNNIANLMRDATEMPLDILRKDRDMLKTHKDAITQDFLSEPSQQTSFGVLLQENLATKRSKPLQKVDLNKISSKNILLRLVQIHSLIIDFNLTTNILTEISFLLNILNADVPDVGGDDVSGNIPLELSAISLNENVKDDVSALSNVLLNINNCTFFALGVLDNQRHLIELFDTTTLKVITENERLCQFQSDLVNYLTSVLAHKIKLEPLRMDESFLKSSANNSSVFYQQESDTKDNFTSEKEFIAFKAQRDLFYVIFRTWQSKHLNPQWTFQSELGDRVCSLLNFAHPINMAHLATLFVSQLKISCNFEDTASELQLALPNIDPEKLSRLRQRLVAPSNFSTNFLFPGNQAFFRDFILIAGKFIIFMEQLKISLINELLDMNNSVNELLDMSDSYSQSKEYEYVITPNVMSTMRVLAKFIGLVVVRPFIYEGLRNSAVDERQIVLRNKTQPPFDLKPILENAVTEHRLIVSLPWIVQYMSMLDYVTLRLTYHRDILQVLYEIYMAACQQRAPQHIQMRPHSLFIVRSSLGWLFDQHNVPDEYYLYRQQRKILPSAQWDPTDDLKEVKILVPSKVAATVFEQDGIDVMLKSVKEDGSNQIQCLFQFKASGQKKDENRSISDPFDVNLDGLLNTACPFLADFRVSIMPSRKHKTVSRTGRYRHITTKRSEDVRPIEDDSQSKLVEAFLLSQSPSMRKSIEFAIERVASAVIKDFQNEQLLPARQSTNDQIQKIKDFKQDSNVKLIMQKIHKIFRCAQDELNEFWLKNIPEMIQKRVKKLLDGLLPNEILPAVRLICIQLVIQKCLIKANDWKNVHLNGIDFFTKDIKNDVEKFIKGQAFRPTAGKSIEIDLSKVSVSMTFQMFQYVLHSASMLPHNLNENIINECLIDLCVCIESHDLPEAMIRMSGFMTLQLVFQIVANRPELLSMEVIISCVYLWKLKDLQKFTTPKSSTEEELNDSSNQSNVPLNNSEEGPKRIKTSPYIFANVLSAHNLELLHCSSSKSYDVLAIFLTQLVDSNLISMSILNAQCLALFKQEWPESVLKNLSIMLEGIKQTTNSEYSQDHLLMEVLSELSRDMENFNN